MYWTSLHWELISHWQSIPPSSHICALQPHQIPLSSTEHLDGFYDGYTVPGLHWLVDTLNIADHTCLKTVISDSVLLPEPPCHTLVTCSKHFHHPTRNNWYSDLSRASHARVYTSYEIESHAVTVRPKSLYASTGRPEYIGVRWHQQNTIGANCTDKDAAAAKGICQGCALGSAHQYQNNQHYVKSTVAHDPGQQFVVDAFTHHSVGTSGFIYAHLFTDLTSCQVYPVFTKSKLVTELIGRMALLFYSHSKLKPNGSRWIWKPLISQLSLQGTVIVSAIVSKPHPHVTNMLMVSLRGQ